MKPKQLARGAIIAALYLALTLVFAPISFGVVQVRLAEALTLLVVLCPEAVAGVVVGCFLANMAASAPLDMVVGTLATLLAALASRALRGVRWKGLAIPAALPPVVFNAVIVGAELTALYAPQWLAPVFLANMLSVGAGQLVSCGVGVLLVWVVEKNPTLDRLFRN